LKVLITGADGFTGRYVFCEAKNRQHTVVALKADLTNLEQLKTELDAERPDVIIHLAAISFVDHIPIEDFYKVNVLGTENIFKSLKSINHTAKVLVASSANIYGNPDTEVINESTTPTPINHYAISKLAMEHVVKTWFSDFPILITRPFNYTGVGQGNNFLIPKIVSHFKANSKSIELGNLDIRRDFSDVSDIAKIYMDLIESQHESLIVNICQGKTISLTSIISYLNTLAGYEIKIETNPKFVRKNEISKLQGDNTLLKSLINFEEFVPIQQTIKNMYDAN
jgi:GDP-6-deoxy-D-talose 4-dehydrogenase